MFVAVTAHSYAARRGRGVRKERGRESTKRAQREAQSNEFLHPIPVQFTTMDMERFLFGVMGQASTNPVGLAHAGECFQEPALSVRKYLSSIRQFREIAYVGQLSLSVGQYLSCNWRGQGIVLLRGLISLNQSYPTRMTPSTFLLSETKSRCYRALQRDKSPALY
jgi:hypothetical protein